MSGDFPRSVPERLPTTSQKLLSLALDAQLAGYEEVARALTSLAERLNEGNDLARLGGTARIVLTRAQTPGIGFETLLDNLDLSEPASKR